jgi:spore coat-associated protein N
MSRLAVLARHPKRTLGSLAALMVAGALVAGSGAVFATQTANPGNAFATGILSQSNSAAAILTGTQIIPGQTKTGTVDIANTGTVQGVFSLSETSLKDDTSIDGATDSSTAKSSSPLSGALTLVIDDCGAWTSNNTVAPSCPSTPDTTSSAKVYAGSMAGLATASPVALKTYAVGETHRYKFFVTLPDNLTTGESPLSSTSVGGTGDNAFSGAYSSATIQFNSTSS